MLFAILGRIIEGGGFTRIRLPAETIARDEVASPAKSRGPSTQHRSCPIA
jgi:hypothetical protein